MYLRTVSIIYYGIYFYCNIATPFLIDEHVIKYIDYDLDLRVFPSGEYKILDRMEYKYHKKIMKYSNDLDYVVRNSLTELINSYKKGHFAFDSKLNLHYYDEYKVLNVQTKESA